MIDLSSFTHIPAVPAAEFDLLPITILTILALALHAVGMVGFRRRDLAAAA